MRRAGIEVEGINFPGHFLLRCPGTRGTRYSRDLIIDAHHGGALLTESMCRQLLSRHAGDEADWDSHLLANATKLNLVSPPEFMQAVAEGNDPPAQSIAQFQQLLQGGNRSVRVLVYNQQTVTPLTQLIRSMAAENQIPTVGMTETVQPLDVPFQNWINGQLIALQNALSAQALGK